MDKALNKEAIRAIRKHAEARYDKGWDVVVECYDDVDIQETLDECDGSVKKAIASLQAYVNLHEMQRVEIESTIF